jgi:hypothetical protein
LVQDTLPSRLLYSPVGQSEHDSDPAAELYVFTVHLLHDVEAVLAEYVPETQTAHTS